MRLYHCSDTWNVTRKRERAGDINRSNNHCIVLALFKLKRTCTSANRTCCVYTTIVFDARVVCGWRSAVHRAAHSSSGERKQINVNQKNIILWCYVPAVRPISFATNRGCIFSGLHLMASIEALQKLVHLYNIENNLMISRSACMHGEKVRGLTIMS